MKYSTVIVKDFSCKEITMIQPKLLLTYGKGAAIGFFDYFLNVEDPPSLSDHISEIIQLGKSLCFRWGSLIPYMCYLSSMRPVLIHASVV